jgi:adenylate cyclase
LVAGATLALVSHGRVELGDGLLYDAAIALAPRAPAGPSKVAVIAIDQGSLSSKMLETRPRAFFSPFYAELLRGLYQADVKAVGFDIDFNYAASRFDAMQRGYDDSFLAELEKHRDRVVLARTLSTVPAETYVGAVFDPATDSGREEPRAIAYAELWPSEDGVQRWIYSAYPADGVMMQALSARLAEIAGKRRIPEAFLLAPQAPLESMPTYALSDVLNCIRTRPDLVKSAFAGKVVLVGSNLPEEDRKRAPDRFLRWTTPTPSHAAADGCNLVTLGPSESGSVPGVHIHAAAVDSILSGTGVVPVALPVSVLVAIGAGVICAALGLFLSPVIAVGALGGFLLVLFATSVALIPSGYWLPVAVPAITALMALLAGQLARFFAEDRRRKRLERAFGCYLAPSIVSQLSDSDLRLGGEEREVAVMFADLNNFTTISDTMGPTELMELTNRYLEVIVEVIDEMGGYVDKFIGDCVMALWGAPAGVPNIQERALRSAFLIQQRMRHLKSNRSGKDRAGFDAKIAISCGRAIVGNVGAPRRLSYTALGATVNLAARLEKVCSTFGCAIVVDAATADALRNQFLFCELDVVALKGKLAPVAVYEAIAPIETATSEQRSYVARYQAALQSYRSGDLHRAADLWLELDASFHRNTAVSPASVMAQRARAGEPVLTLHGTG